MEPLEKILVLLPRWNLLHRGEVAEFLKGSSFHFKVCPGIDLSRFDISVAQKIADDLQGDSTLLQCRIVH